MIIFVNVSNFLLKMRENMMMSLRIYICKEDEMINILIDKKYMYWVNVICKGKLI